MNKRRLLKLAEFLEKLPRKRFNYRRWVGGDWGGAKDLSCGTNACALGWATTIPTLRRAGLRLEPYASNASKTWGGGYVTLAQPTQRFRSLRSYGIGESIAAGAVAFDLTDVESMFLFSPFSRWSPPVVPHGNATPKQVARHICKFVERGGMPE